MSFKYETVPQEDEDVINDAPESVVDINGSTDELDGRKGNDNVPEGYDVIDIIRADVLRSMIISLTEKKTKLRDLRRQEVLTGESQSISSFSASMAAKLVRMRRRCVRGRDFLISWEVWKSHMIEIGGHFGNGVLSYFTFLRWLVFLNIYLSMITILFAVIPKWIFPLQTCMQPTQNGTTLFRTFSKNYSTSTQFNNLTKELYQKKYCYFERTQKYLGNIKRKSDVDNVADFFTGTGWIKETAMFYGSYPNAFLLGFNVWMYNMPLAYLLVVFGYLLLSLYIIISSAIHIFEAGFVKGGNKNAFTYSNKVFGAWDMCIKDEKACELASESIAHEFEADIEEERHIIKKRGRTQREKNALHLLRFAMNLVILLLLVLGGWAIYVATNISVKASSKNPKSKEYLHLLKTYSSSLTITGVNMLLPPLFYKLSDFEDRNPRTRVNVDLSRNVLLKLSSVAVLMITLYRGIQKKSTTKIWENTIGAEIYKLIWTDFIVLLAVTLLVEFPKTYIARRFVDVDCGCIKLKDKIVVPEFSIPQNVLELVYAQTLIWLGTLFSPLLPVMGICRLILAFYIKKISLMVNFDPPKKPYRAGKSNYFFMVLQLISFGGSLVAAVYAITQVKPSNSVGPFRGFHRMYDVFALSIASLPSTLRYVYNLLLSPVIIISFVILLCVILYFFFSMSQMYMKKIKELEMQLSAESREKKTLLKTVAKVADFKKVIEPEEKND